MFPPIYTWGKSMKTLFALGLFFAATLGYAQETNLICNDQNSHAVYKITLSKDLNRAALIPLLADSSLISDGAPILRFMEGESGELSVFGGNSAGINIALEFNREQAVSLKKYEILDVLVFAVNKATQEKYSTSFLCSKNSF